MTVLRTKRDGCWELTTNSWGTYLAPAVDPDADTIITPEQLNGFEINPDVVPIPADLWSRWVQLCIELTRRNSSNLEVSCRLLRDTETRSKYRILVPEQKVTTVSVRVETFDRAIDIETGEVVTQWPPEGWSPCGSSHSHNTMEAFFSGTDDQYELGDPGLHIVVGQIDVTNSQYTLKASITANKRRFIVNPKLVADISGSDKTYHPDVLNVITLPNQQPKRSVSVLPTVYDYTDGLDFDVPQTDQSFLNVAPEIKAVMEAVDTLMRVSDELGVSVSGVLDKVATDIEDLSLNAPGLTPLNVDDPFYWTSY